MSQQAQTALLICNGEMASSEIVHSLVEQVDLVICADGGANAAHEMDILPDVIIGDFDSISSDSRAHFSRAGVSLLHLTSQDDTDFEKALIYLKESGVQSVAVCGVTGKLLDHTLGNFSILLRYLDVFRIVLFDPHYRVDVITAGKTFSARAGDRVSIVPLAPASGVSYSGLRYPFEKPLLAFGIAEGTCNESLGDNFSVNLESGVLLVFRELHSGMLEL